jgi:hypothetical protein
MNSKGHLNPIQKVNRPTTQANGRSLHAIRVSCKRAHSLLLAARSEKANSHESKRIDQWLKVIHEVKHGLEKYRDEDVLIDILGSITRKKKNRVEHPLIVTLIKKASSHSRSGAELRNAAIQNAKGALKLLSSQTIYLDAEINLTPSYRKAYRLYRYCRAHSDQAFFHAWRKKISILRYQLKAKLRADSNIKIGRKRKLKHFSMQLKELSDVIGDERDISRSEKIFSGGNKKSSSKSMAIFQKKKRKLKKESIRKGSRVFANRPKYWIGDTAH